MPSNEFRGDKAPNCGTLTGLQTIRHDLARKKTLADESPVAGILGPRCARACDTACHMHKCLPVTLKAATPLLEARLYLSPDDRLETRTLKQLHVQATATAALSVRAEPQLERHDAQQQHP